MREAAPYHPGLDTPDTAPGMLTEARDGCPERDDQGTPYRALWPALCGLAAIVVAALALNWI